MLRGQKIGTERHNQKNKGIKRKITRISLKQTNYLNLGCKSRWLCVERLLEPVNHTSCSLERIKAVHCTTYLLACVTTRGGNVRTVSDKRLL